MEMVKVKECDVTNCAYNNNQMCKAMAIRVGGSPPSHLRHLHDGFDFALHIEAGYVPRLGLHIRSDGIRNEEFSEAMLQYAVMADKDMS